jgi:8-oxo-dGTP pyrophosphatase MutT (NUDIX family)
MTFERIGSETAWEGRIATVRVDRFRYDDGQEAEREIVAHPGAVAVVAHDGDRIYLVRQPREAVDEQALLELPAGKLDEEGEEPLDAAKRELAEEIGKGALAW